MQFQFCPFQQISNKIISNMLTNILLNLSKLDANLLIYPNMENKNKCRQTCGSFFFFFEKTLHIISLNHSFQLYGHFELGFINGWVLSSIPQPMTPMKFSSPNIMIMSSHAKFRSLKRESFRKHYSVGNGQHQWQYPKWCVFH